MRVQEQICRQLYVSDTDELKVQISTHFNDTLVEIYLNEDVFYYVRFKDVSFADACSAGGILNRVFDHMLGETHTDGLSPYVGKSIVESDSTIIIPENSVAILRDSKTVESGYAYEYKALENSAWVVTGTDVYAGTVSEDTVLYFYYEQVDPDVPIPTPDPEPTISEDEPEEPIVPIVPEVEVAQPSEPKTGDTKIPFGMLSLTSIAAFLTALFSKKKRQ